MPIAISIKNVENPVTQIFLNLRKICVGFTRYNVFDFDKKCNNMMKHEITDPIAVANPAPKIPISKRKTKV